MEPWRDRDRGSWVGTEFEVRFTEAVKKMGGKLVIREGTEARGHQKLTKGIRNQGCLQMDLEETGR